MPDAAAHPTGAEGAAVATRSGKPGWLKRLLSWQKHLTGTIDLDREPTGHGRRNAWIIVAAAVVVGSSLGVQDWQSVWDKPYLGRYLGVDAVAALVLTSLALTIYLSLREIATRLLRRLDHNGVIDCAAGGKSLNQFALEMDGWLDHWWVWVPTVVVTAGYFTYMLLDELNEMTSPLGTLLIVITLVVLAALFYVGVVAIAQIGVACWAIGGLFRKFSEFEISVQPLHPDGCGGLRPIGHMLSLVLSVAAILGGASLCIFLTVEATPPDRPVARSHTSWPPSTPSCSPWPSSTWSGGRTTACTSAARSSSRRSRRSSRTPSSQRDPLTPTTHSSSRPRLTRCRRSAGSSGCLTTPAPSGRCSCDDSRRCSLLPSSQWQSPF
jgi:hypothetical protein